MKGDSRREKIIEILRHSDNAVSGGSLADRLNVSRQVIVQDIALLRANSHEIISTNMGYILLEDAVISRVFKVVHTDEQAKDELNIIVDCGGVVTDVFIFHRAYGTVRADMDIRSRADVIRFCNDIEDSSSRLLLNITNGYHYHTVIADNEETLDLIQQRLQAAGFLANLKDYEPIDF
ncbi:MAG: transcription repressor NadR [Bacillota bacterium]|nr:transcription repressor NadR [Bacillota bacterium]